MKTLVTPVGTSLFTNYLDKNSNDETSKSYYDTIKKRPASEWGDYESEINDLKRVSLSFIGMSGVQASAELQSIAKIRCELNEELKVRLLASGTIASRLAAEILADNTLADNTVTPVLGSGVRVEFDSEKDVIKGLQVEDPKAFSNEGMTNLIQKIDQEASGYWPKLAINITGGFKATLPYLTILAQLKHIPLYYNFEDTDSLIKIPQAPLVIDWGLIERYSDILMQIDKGVEGNWPKFKKRHYQAVQNLEAFIEVDDKDALLSPIGTIFWEEYQNYFVVELPGGSYYGYNSTDRRSIDGAIEELYRRLRAVLSDTCLQDCDGNLIPDKCYEKIRNLGHNDDLNHGRQIPNPTESQDREIFIFKSTNDVHIRLLYTFKVNSKKITRLKIFDLLCRDFDHESYIDDWKTKFGEERFPEINFVTRTLEIP